MFDLGKETIPTLIDHPWAQELELPDDCVRPLPAEAKISDVFREVGESLLILGQPGSGKTISLLELARDLIFRAEQEPDEPIPVVFNLSSWKHRGQPFENWLIEELRTKYQIPKRFGSSLLIDNRLLLLLDGLDEVVDDYRSDCVKAINRFVEHVGVPGIAVCSRSSEYVCLSQYLTLRGAVRLLPLTLSQIESYLEAAGSKLSALRDLFAREPAIQELATSPLMLDVMYLAYEGRELIDLSANSLRTPEQRTRHLFEAYVRRMFERKKKESLYDPQQVTHYLGWLAWNMKRQSIKIFQIENLQPNWLSAKPRRRDYYLLSRLVAGLALALVLFLASGPIFETEVFLFDALVMMAITLLVWGLLSGGIVGLIDAHNCETKTDDITGRQLSSTQVTKNIIVIGFFASCVAGFIGMVSAWDNYWLNQGLLLQALGQDPITRDLPMRVIATSVAKWLREALILGLTFGSWRRMRNIESDIQTFEKIRWSATGLTKSAIWGAIVGLGFGLVGVLVEVNGGVMASPQPSKIGWLIGWAIAALIWIPVGAGIGAIAGGLKATITDDKSKLNQGMDLTIKHAERLGLTAALCGFLIGAVISNVVEGLGLELSYRLSMYARVGSFLGALRIGLKTAFLYTVHGGLDKGMLWGLIAGLAVALRFGGIDAIRHCVLRWMLAKDKCLPYDYRNFLNHASNLIFVRNAGGGYMFLHETLQDHFATSYEATMPARERGA